MHTCMYMDDSVIVLVPCEWVWSEMSECTVTCKGGTRYRYPILTRAPTNGGRPCPNHVIRNKTEKYRCNEHPCPSKAFYSLPHQIHTKHSSGTHV